MPIEIVDLPIENGDLPEGRRWLVEGESKVDQWFVGLILPRSREFWCRMLLKKQRSANLTSVGNVGPLVAMF